MTMEQNCAISHILDTRMLLGYDLMIPAVARMAENSMHQNLV